MVNVTGDPPSYEGSAICNCDESTASPAPRQASHTRLRPRAKGYAKYIPLLEGESQRDMQNTYPFNGG